MCRGISCTTLRRWSRERIGFGRLVAPIWLLGAKEVFRGDGAELVRRLRGDAVEDLRDAYRRIRGHADLFRRTRPRVHPTWRGLVCATLAALGEPTTPADAGRYQATRLARANGETLLASVFPLPVPARGRWPYADICDAHELVSRERFMAEVAQTRVSLLRRLYSKHRPALVIAWGRQDWPTFERIFDRFVTHREPVLRGWAEILHVDERHAIVFVPQPAIEPETKFVAVGKRMRPVLARSLYARPSRSAARVIASRYKKDSCERCGGTRDLQVHHLDGDWRNNVPSNLRTLCRRCHNREHPGPGPTATPIPPASEQRLALAARWGALAFEKQALGFLLDEVPDGYFGWSWTFMKKKFSILGIHDNERLQSALLVELAKRELDAVYGHRESKEDWGARMGFANAPVMVQGRIAGIDAELAAFDAPAQRRRS